MNKELKLRKQLILSIYSLGVFMGMFACISTLWSTGLVNGAPLLLSMIGALGSFAWAMYVKKQLGWKNGKR